MPRLVCFGFDWHGKFFKTVSDDTDDLWELFVKGFEFMNKNNPFGGDKPIKVLDGKMIVFFDHLLSEGPDEEYVQRSATFPKKMVGTPYIYCDNRKEFEFEISFIESLPNVFVLYAYSFKQLTKRHEKRKKGTTFIPIAAIATEDDLLPSFVYLKYD